MSNNIPDAHHNPILRDKFAKDVVNGVKGGIDIDLLNNGDIAVIGKSCRWYGPVSEWKDALRAALAD